MTCACTFLLVVLTVFGAVSTAGNAAAVSNLPTAHSSEKTTHSSQSSLVDSLGKTRQYVGPVDSLAQLTEALQACSYQKELILIATTGDFVDAAAQTVGMLTRHNIGHVVIITVSESACFNTHKFITSTCCVWSTLQVPTGEQGSPAKHAFASHRLLMISRMALAARALRLGYNLLFLDTDIVIFDDPYRFLKRPPFSKANLMLKGSSHDVNIGVMYVQNAAPDGPIAWAFAEVLDRMLRWAEAPSFLPNHTNPTISNLQHVLWDQVVFADAIFSTVVGRPTFQGSWSFQDPGLKTLNRTWRGMHKALVSRFMHPWKGPAAPSIKRLSRESRLSLVHFALHRPFTSGIWPEALGGPGFPAQRGNFSILWQQTLRGSGAPMWPDPDDPTCHDMAELWRTGGRRRRSQAPADATDSQKGSNLQREGRGPASEGDTAAASGECPGRGRTEHALFMPNWLVSSWTAAQLARSQQDWSFKTQPPTQVIGHAVFLQHDKTIYKSALKMSLGWYNWSIPIGPRPGGPYFASTPTTAVPTVLAASPQLLASISRLPIQRLPQVLRALFIAAVVAGRALAWPALLCEALRSTATPKAREGRNMPPSGQDRPALYHGAIPFALSSSHDMCIWTEYLCASCLEGGRGLLPPEMAHLMSSMQQSKTSIVELPLATTPEPEEQLVGTLLEEACSNASTLEGRRPQASQESGSVCMPLSTTTLAEYMLAIEKHAQGHKVLLLNSIPIITDAMANTTISQTLRKPLQACWALRLPDQ